MGQPGVVRCFHWLSANFPVKTAAIGDVTIDPVALFRKGDGYDLLNIIAVIFLNIHGDIILVDIKVFLGKGASGKNSSQKKQAKQDRGDLLFHMVYLPKVFKDGTVKAPSVFIISNQLEWTS